MREARAPKTHIKITQSRLTLEQGHPWTARILRPQRVRRPGSGQSDAHRRQSNKSAREPVGTRSTDLEEHEVEAFALPRSGFRRRCLLLHWRSRPLPGGPLDSHRARSDFRRLVCHEDACPNDGPTRGRCEIGPSFCPSCGRGPLMPEELSWYPARINHREAYTCLTCMESAHACW